MNGWLIFAVIVIGTFLGLALWSGWRRVPEPEPEPEPEPWPQPWRDGPMEANARLVPLSLVRSLADDGELRMDRLNDADQIAQLAEQLKAEGVITPLLLQTDGTMAQLTDGYHRLAALDDLGVAWVPVRWEKVPRLSKQCKELYLVLLSLHSMLESKELPWPE